jgi:hypothetical protein
MACRCSRCGWAARHVCRPSIALTYLTWLAWSPSERRVLVVTGGGRETWFAKTLALCDVEGVQCETLRRPRGVISLNPPDRHNNPAGRLANVSDARAGNPNSPLPRWRCRIEGPAHATGLSSCHGSPARIAPGGRGLPTGAGRHQSVTYGPRSVSAGVQGTGATATARDQ